MHRGKKILATRPSVPINQPFGRLTDDRMNASASKGWKKQSCRAFFRRLDGHFGLRNTIEVTNSRMTTSCERARAVSGHSSCRHGAMAQYTTHVGKDQWRIQELSLGMAAFRRRLQPSPGQSLYSVGWKLNTVAYLTFYFACNFAHERT